MLTYLGDGTRRYGRQPVLIEERPFWEFQAVIKGEIGLALLNCPVRFRRQRLWLFPPHHPHGWTGRGATAAEIVVFHFPVIPEPLRLKMQAFDYLELSLNAAAGARLRRLAQAARKYWSRPGPGMPLCHEHILLELSLLFLEQERSSPEARAWDRLNPVDRCLTWFSQRMADNPSLEEAARAGGVSPAHMRRLFHQTFQASPKSVFDQLRFQRSFQLMADPALKLETISAQCGFGSGSAFSRAFRNKFGRSPEAWRIRM